MEGLVLVKGRGGSSDAVTLRCWCRCRCRCKWSSSSCVSSYVCLSSCPLTIGTTIPRQATSDRSLSRRESLTPLLTSVTQDYAHVLCCNTAVHPDKASKAHPQDFFDVRQAALDFAAPRHHDTRTLRSSPSQNAWQAKRDCVAQTA